VARDIRSAQVIVKRRRLTSGSLLPWTVWLDNEKVGRLPVNGSLAISTSPGRHSIMVSQPSPVRVDGDPFHFTAEAGERIELAAQAMGISGQTRVWLPDLPYRSSSDSGTMALPVRPPNRPRSKSPTLNSSKVIEGTRRQVSLGEDTRIVDNSKSKASARSVVRFTREWTKEYSLEFGQLNTLGGGSKIDLHVLSLKGEIERTLEKAYSFTSGERKESTQEITLHIPGYTKSEITFSWKEIHQEGVVRLEGTDFETGSDYEIDIPYDIVVDLTFDLRQVDAP
jgi:hypothetical protein